VTRGNSTVDMKSPWVRLREPPDCVLTCDAKYVDAFNRGAKASTRIRTNLVAEPFFGRADAPVVLLLLNPGVGVFDARWHARKDYRSSLLRAVRSNRQIDHFHLNSEADAPGAKWWRRACRPLVRQLALDDEDGFRLLAKRLLCVEYFPYHSKRFAHGHLRLPSQQYAFKLVADAVRRSAEVVCMRGEKEWKGAVPELVGYERFRKLRYPRVSSLSAANVPRFGALLAAIRDSKAER
jgi:hypothetical protein